MIDLTRSLGIGKNVHLLGYRNDIPDLYRIMDIYIFPSIREGLGLAVIEGMAFGLPLICSNNRGMREYAFEGAIRCNPMNEREFALAIKTMMTNMHIENLDILINNIQKDSVLRLLIR